MDPTANLKEQREIFKRILAGGEFADQEFLDDAVRLAELVEALDDWIMACGFLPGQWTKARRGCERLRSSRR